jgi:hypothetical protein
MKYDLSYCASAIKVQNWDMIYDNIINQNKGRIQIVFVGPRAPDHEIGEHFKFIQTNVKPAQCYEIAFRNSDADLIFIDGNDDTIVRGNHPIDRLIDEYYAKNDPMQSFSAVFTPSVHPPMPSANVMFYGEPNTPLAGFCVLHHSMIKQLGGLDKKFVAICSCLDLMMRFYAIGGSLTILHDVLFNADLPDLSHGTALYGEFVNTDRAFFNSLWHDNERWTLNRQAPFEPFEDDNILTVSQGNKGRWM